MINTEGVQIEAVAAAAVTFGPYHGQQGRQYTHAYTSTPEAGCVSVYGTFTRRGPALGGPGSTDFTLHVLQDPKHIRTTFQTTVPSPPALGASGTSSRPLGLTLGRQWLLACIGSLQCPECPVPRVH